MLPGAGVVRVSLLKSMNNVPPRYADVSHIGPGNVVGEAEPELFVDLHVPLPDAWANSSRSLPGSDGQRWINLDIQARLLIGADQVQLTVQYDGKDAIPRRIVAFP